MNALPIYAAGIAARDAGVRLMAERSFGGPGRELEAGESRTPEPLDVIAAGMRRDGKDVEVVYVPRRNAFRIVPREQVA